MEIEKFISLLKNKNEFYEHICLKKGYQIIPFCHIKVI